MLLSWVYSLLTKTLALLCSLAFVAITWLGLIFVRPFLRVWLRSQPGANDLVGQASAGFSLFYGLMLGLLSVAAYQNSEDVRRTVNLEAASLASLYRVAAVYPEPLSSELQYLLRDYTLYVIHEDWPAHEQGRLRQGGMLRLQAIEHHLLTFEPATKTQEILHTETLGHFNALADMREQRLAGARTTIPGVLWYVVGIGAAINIILLWMFDMRFFTHVLLGGIVSFFLGVMIFVIAAMGNPMRSGVMVSPEAYQTVYDTLMRVDESP